MKVSMVQVGELFLKELGEGKQFKSKQDTGRHRGKLQKRKTDPLKLSLKLFFSQHLPLIHCQVTHIIPRDTLANGFCGESLTYDWSHDCLCRCPGCAGCSDTSWSAHRTNVGLFPTQVPPTQTHPKYVKKGLM